MYSTCSLFYRAYMNCWPASSTGLAQEGLWTEVVHRWMVVFQAAPKRPLERMWSNTKRLCDNGNEQSGVPEQGSTWRGVGRWNILLGFIWKTYMVQDAGCNRVVIYSCLVYRESQSQSLRSLCSFTQFVASCYNNHFCLYGHSLCPSLWEGPFPLGCEA